MACRLKCCWPGNSVSVEAKHVPFFKAGKELRSRLNNGHDPEDRD
jgi:integration host factor subunit beta